MHRIPFVFFAAFLALAAVLSVTAGPPDGAADLTQAVAAQERHSEALMARPGVVGTAVGRDGGGGLAVLVLVETNDVAGLPVSLDGVPTRVVVSGPISVNHHQAGHSGGPGGTTESSPGPSCSVPGSSFDETQYMRPAYMGMSTGHPDITAGTIGARVLGNGKVYALSNNHVYADENLATLNDPVLQPGDYDGGSVATDVLGQLADFEPIVFSTSASNVIDAAIAVVTAGDLAGSPPPDGYGAPSNAPVVAALDMCVQKYGRTTGWTGSVVSGVNAIVNVGYSRGTARFVDQILISGSGFSAGGDSGSLIVDQAGNNPVGLLYAGSSTLTVANPIQDVLARFNVTVDGSAPADPPADEPPPAEGGGGGVALTASSINNGSTWTAVVDVNYGGWIGDVVGSFDGVPAACNPTCTQFSLSGIRKRTASVTFTLTNVSGDSGWTEQQITVYKP